MKNGWFGWNLTECFQYEEKLQLTFTAVKLIILQWSPFSVQGWLSWCRACPFLFSSLFHDPTRESTGFYTLRIPCTRKNKWCTDYNTLLKIDWCKVVTWSLGIRFVSWCTEWAHALKERGGGGGWFFKRTAGYWSMWLYSFGRLIGQV